LASRSTQLFIGRLPLEVRQRELEDIFYRYGKLARCDIKYGKTMAYGFVEYEDRRDAEDALRGEDGKLILGSRMVVEWVRNATPRPSGGSAPRGGRSFGKSFGGGSYGGRARSSRSPSPRKLSPGVTRRRSLSPLHTYSSRDRFDTLNRDSRDRYTDRLGERDRFGERDRDRFMDRDRDRFNDRLGERYNSRGSRTSYRSPSPPLSRRGRFR